MRRLLLFPALLALAACSAHRSLPSPERSAQAATPEVLEAESPAAVVVEASGDAPESPAAQAVALGCDESASTARSAGAAVPCPVRSATHAAAVRVAASDEDDDVAPAESSGDEELESVALSPSETDGVRYTADLDDATLTEAFEKAPEKLGPISVGFAHQGRIINAVQFPPGEGYIVVRPDAAWTTQETVDYSLAAIRRVREQYPDAPPLRVNQISAREGGWMRPHKSHQSGRDVDFGFYYPTAEPIRVRERERVIDRRLSFALIEALVTETDVQLILVDRRVIQVLHEQALADGKDPAWLDSLFKGPNAIVKHAKRHRDHFHVRFFNPRAQELGRRVAPLLAKRPGENVLVHRVRSGDTLGHIALRYGTTVKALQQENRLKGTFLSLGQRLRVRLRGPCTSCPVPPQVVLPARRLPPPPSAVSSVQPDAEAAPRDRQARL